MQQLSKEDKIIKIIKAGFQNDYDRLDNLVPVFNENEVVENIIFEMSEYSKQTAIAFANFINEKQYIENGSKNGVWYKRGGGINSYTTDRLYELFEQHLQSLNK